MPKQLFLFFSAILVGLNFLVSSPTRASEITLQQDAANKINIAGRQRMLSQRMAKSVCFMQWDLTENRETHEKELIATLDLFELSRKALRSGNPEMGLLPSELPAIKGALAKADLIWLRLDKMIRKGIEKEAFSKKDLEDVERLSNVLLSRSQTVTVQMVEAYGGRSMEENLARTLNIAGRQRMLSQKVGKELCMMLSGIRLEESREALEMASSLFDDSVFALAFGSNLMNIHPTGSIEIEWQNTDLLTVWYMIEDIFLKALDGEPIDDQDKAMVIKITDVLLRESNNAVEMYKVLAQPVSN